MLINFILFPSQSSCCSLIWSASGEEFLNQYLGLCRSVGCVACDYNLQKQRRVCNTFKNDFFLKSWINFSISSGMPISILAELEAGVGVTRREVGGRRGLALGGSGWAAHTQTL